MATSTLYQSSQLGSPAGSPRSCLYASPHQSFQPRADWRASFTESCRVPPPPKPLILRQLKEHWKPNLDHPSPQLQPENPSNPSNPPKAEVDRLISPLRSRLTLGRKQKSLRCHVCQATIREPYFQYHLFFGMVKCDLCGLFCGDCRIFERVKMNVERNYSSCLHSFSYTEDPYEYLLPRLSGSDDIDVGGSLTLPNNLRVLQHYLNQLRSLQLRDPWSNAVRNCKSRLLKFHTSSSQVESSDTQNGFPSSVKIDKKDDSSETPPEKPRSRTPVEPESEEEEIDVVGLLLTQDYDLEHLEQAVEYVGVDEDSRFSDEGDRATMQNKTKKRRKTNPYKKMKGHRFKAQKRKQTTMPPPPVEDHNEEEEELELVMEDIGLPEDGNYLMVKEALEECPMCYESLSLKNCSVNMRTFLFTVTCTECGLLIFIVPDLPDGLKIVVEGRTDEPPKPIEQVKSRKIQPRDFFAK